MIESLLSRPQFAHSIVFVITLEEAMISSAADGSGSSNDRLGHRIVSAFLHFEALQYSNYGEIYL